MIPITRKELYLNKIVGNDDYDIPEKPITEEEFFFAEILGEAVQAPEPLTRYQMYLAKIAGKNIEIPYPETRLEYFLAKAAGMDVETPVPITREEIYWSNYTAIVEFELENVPPLTYKAIEGTLENYRFYGNTVGGESVGDLVTSGEHTGEYKVPVTVEGKNLLPNTATSKTINGVTFTVNSDGSVTCNGTANGGTALFGIPAITLPAGQYSINGCPVGGDENTTYKILIIANNEWLTNDKGSGANFTLTETSTISVRMAIYNGYTCDNLTFYPMIRKADIEDDTYEPYHAPITTPIYLPEQIRKVGDEAEYIDYGEQKMHRVRKNLLQNTATSQTINTELDVTLPTLPTLPGTNMLSVGTAVQPSKVYIKYIKGESKKITTTYVQSIEPDNTNNKITFVVRAYLSKNDRMVRTGLVATNDPAIGVNINVNSTVITSGCKVFVKELAGVTPTTDNAEYAWTKTKVTDGEIWYVRSYVEYINSDNEQLIIYSGAAKASLDGII